MNVQTQHQSFLVSLSKIEKNPEIQKLRLIPQHKGNSTFSHCHDVAIMSSRLANLFHWTIDTDTLARGCMLHDDYLYDTETMPYTDFQHARIHPKIACRNANKHFSLNKKEQNIILSHMWPIPGSPLPRCKEAWLVCVADKICAFREIYLHPKK